jgi:LytS/YehU family sensor histidine kinase
MNGLIQHRRESTEYVQPAHIIAQARRAKRERMREEQAKQPLAIMPRTTPPENFRQMIAEACPQTVQQEVADGEQEARRAAARAELAKLTAGVGAMP